MKLMKNYHLRKYGIIMNPGRGMWKVSNAYNG